MIPGSITPLLLNSAAAGGLQIERSLRFNSSDSAYLSRAVGTAGNRRTWTWSAWVKRSVLSTFQVLFGAGDSSSEPNIEFDFGAGGGDSLRIRMTIGVGNEVLQLKTTQVFRDVSAWYHIVVAFDTTQGTASDRIKLYVNGSQVTTFSTSTYPSQNLDTWINATTYQHVYGRLGAYNDYYFNGYLANTHLIDGQQLTPSSFTETDATTGQLIPKTYTGSYGTNGFNLLFADNSSNTASTLGKDTSGLSNNFTPNNFSVTAGAGNDSLVDSPTNYGTDTGVGGEVRGNYCVINPLSIPLDTPTLSNGNLDLTATGTNQAKLGTMVLPSSGKWYWEILCQSGGSGVWVLGIGNSDETNGNSGRMFYVSDARKYNGTFSGYGATYTVGDVIGVAVDMDAATLTFYKNGVSQGVAFSSITTTLAKGIVPYFQGEFSGRSMSFNAGQRAFAYTAPSGYKTLCTQNLPAPLVTKSNEVMDVVTYTGTGAALTPTSSLGFNPDWIWIKSRSAATDHALYDVVRGAQARLESNTIDAEVTTDGGVTAFNSAGFTLGTLAQVNTSAATYAAWCWDAGTSTVSNPDGSIISQVRANPTAGFSIVKYTGLLGGGSWGHGLGVEPKFIIFKRYTAAQNWWVFHKTTGSWRKFEGLNNTNADSADSMSASSTVVTLVTNTDFNSDPSSNYFAYCFTPVVGYSSFGSYTGNASADGPMVYLGFRPRFVIIKCSSTSNSYTNWDINDSARNTYNAADNTLCANLSDEENSANIGGQSLDFLANGFKIRQATSSSKNLSGQTYIYAAFAEAPFNYSRAR